MTLYINIKYVVVSHYTTMHPAAPAAFEESVRVCMDCKAVLDNYAENARISNSMASTSAPT